MRLMNTRKKNEGIPAGARRIQSNVRSLSGEVNGQEFESSLERDLLMLAHWNNEVDWYQAQPVTINYLDSLGKARSYTPDLLVSFILDKKSDKQTERRKPLLCEVKFRSDYAKMWKELKPKFRAAKAYAKENGYEFLVITEREIRTDYLINIKFLWRHRFDPSYPEHNKKLIETLKEMSSSDPNTLLNTCCTTKTQRGEAMWSLWNLIANDIIQCDLKQKLTMQTKIWIES